MERDIRDEYIGILATDEDIRKTGGENEFKDSVFINKMDDIQFSVKSMSNNASAEFYTGYINTIVGNEDYKLDEIYEGFDSKERRKNNFKEKINSYLFIFQESSNEQYDKIYRAYLTEKPSTITYNDKFFSAPVFSSKESVSEWESKGQYSNRSLQREYSSLDELIERLKEGRPIGKIWNYSERNNPKFIVWYDDIEKKMVALGPITGIQYGIDGAIIRFNELYKLDISDHSDYLVYNIKCNPSVLHIVEKAYKTICQEFDQPKDADPIVIIDSAVQDNAIESREDDAINIDINKKDDETLLNIFLQSCENDNLFYDPKDLTNFHTSVKTGSLVILSGMSGTGKSAIVDRYARALGFRSGDDNRFLMIPVRPSWNDDADLLGYVDLVHMVYRPSDTGFVKLLVDASKPTNKNKLYFVCFDEMNLARVEHYFSQFLSILEKPSGSRKLRLYDEQYKGRLYNDGEYPDIIDIGDNIHFVGTVNIDESTYHFADKVLDRSNVITLHILPFQDWKKHKFTGYTNNSEWKRDEFIELTKTDDKVENQELKDFFWDFHCILEKSTTSLGIGPRVLVSVNRYLNNLPPENNIFSISKNEGIDLQVKQRVLTKIRGSEDQLADLFDEKSDCSIMALFQKYSQLSAFTECKAVVEQKKKELKVYGYCL